MPSPSPSPTPPPSGLSPLPPSPPPPPQTLSAPPTANAAACESGRAPLPGGGRPLRVQHTCAAPGGPGFTANRGVRRKPRCRAMGVRADPTRPAPGTRRVVASVPRGWLVLARGVSGQGVERMEEDGGKRGRQRARHAAARDSRPDPGRAAHAPSPALHPPCPTAHTPTQQPAPLVQQPQHEGSVTGQAPLGQGPDPGAACERRCASCPPRVVVRRDPGVPAGAGKRAHIGDGQALEHLGQHAVGQRQQRRVVGPAGGGRRGRRQRGGGGRHVCGRAPMPARIGPGAARVGSGCSGSSAVGEWATLPI